MNKIINARADIASLVTRLIIGGIFINAGWMKVTHMDMILGFFSNMNIPPVLTYIVAYGELIAGVLLVLGLFTRYAATFVTVVIIVATFLTYKNPENNLIGHLAIIAAAVALIGSGAGKFALNKFKKSQAPAAPTV